ncbi:hypothetical protein HPB51_009004 [Rhipicephalus microplus]|uniref:Uncharacterized protein n=1 Tax=Rhipicephalus microplus TaxID=6941 RepID=A0A9J6ERS0_RHIMP|nr:hypothetical protein HPB51_009004 [Rhipicephalus microplus]
MVDVAVNVQQANAQPRGGKRKATDPQGDLEKEFSDFKQERAGVVRDIQDAIAGVSSAIQTLSAMMEVVEQNLSSNNCTDCRDSSLEKVDLDSSFSVVEPGSRLPVKTKKDRSHLNYAKGRVQIHLLQTGISTVCTSGSPQEEVPIRHLFQDVIIGQPRRPFLVNETVKRVSLISAMVLKPRRVTSDFRVSCKSITAGLFACELTNCCNTAFLLREGLDDRAYTSDGVLNITYDSGHFLFKVAELLLEISLRVSGLPLTASALRIRLLKVHCHIHHASQLFKWSFNLLKLFSELHFHPLAAVSQRCARIISTLHALRRRHRRRIQGQGELLKLHSQYHGCVLDLSQRYFPAVRPTYQYETRAREKPLTPRGADKKPPNSPVL